MSGAMRKVMSRATTLSQSINSDYKSHQCSPEDAVVSFVVRSHMCLANLGHLCESKVISCYWCFVRMSAICKSQTNRKMNQLCRNEVCGYCLRTFRGNGKVFFKVSHPCISIRHQVWIQETHTITISVTQGHSPVIHSKIKVLLISFRCHSFNGP